EAGLDFPGPEGDRPRADAGGAGRVRRDRPGMAGRAAPGGAGKSGLRRPAGPTIPPKHALAAAPRPKRRRTLPRLSDLTRSRDGFPNFLNPGRWLPLPPIWMEGRIATEFMALQRDPVFTGKGVPRGDGRPVLLVPGFWSGDFSMNILGAWLRRVGYLPELGGINFNIRYSEVLIKALAKRLLEVYRGEGR